MSDTGANAEIAGLRFEEAFARLEQTLEELRGDGLALDRALALYERGTLLAAHCDRLLADAELRVTTLTPDNSTSATRAVREERSTIYIEGEW